MIAWTLTLIPLVALVAGAAVAVLRAPGRATTSALQHFAAGVVFAAAAAEILPDLKHEGQIVPLMLGAVVAVALMLLVRSLAGRAKGLSLAAVSAIDIGVDGLVLGIGFTVGAKQGVLLTVALTVEILFLGVSIALAVRTLVASRVKAIAITSAAGLLLPLGVLLGTFAGGLSPPYITASYAFGLAALLYLVTEELLVEAHKQPEGPVITALFFAGFFALLILDDMIT